AFQDLCGRLITAQNDVAGRSAVLLFGREQVRWARYDEPHTQDPWSRYIRTQELKGFSESNAVAFLRNDYSQFWKDRKAERIAEQLREFEVEILNASEEKPSPPGARTFLPYYLRLAGEIMY